MKRTAILPILPVLLLCVFLETSWSMYQNLKDSGNREDYIAWMDDTKKALKEIDRVLRYGGILIAPNFVEHKAGFGSSVWSGILTLAGIRFEHRWSGPEYLEWLDAHGWNVTFSREMAARITLMYTECRRKEE